MPAPTTFPTLPALPNNGHNATATSGAPNDQKEHIMYHINTKTNEQTPISIKNSEAYLKAYAAFPKSSLARYIPTSDLKEAPMLGDALLGAFITRLFLQDLRFWCPKNGTGYFEAVCIKKLPESQRGATEEDLNKWDGWLPLVAFLASARLILKYTKKDLIAFDLLQPLIMAAVETHDHDTLYELRHGWGVSKSDVSSDNGEILLFAVMRGNLNGLIHFRTNWGMEKVDWNREFSLGIRLADLAALHSIKSELEENW